MRCVDNSELTLDRIEDTAKQIKFYRDSVRTGDWTDTFYEGHLAVLETGLRVLRDKLSPIVSKDDWIAFYTTSDFISAGVNIDVIKFIADILYHQGPENSEIIRSLFRAGYCYYFAQILQDAFGRGSIHLAYPFGHIVWVDDNSIAYDIEGVNKEYEKLIPISEMGVGINDFKHVPGLSSGLSEDAVNFWTNSFKGNGSEEPTQLSLEYLNMVSKVIKEQNLDMKIQDVIKLLPKTELDKDLLESTIVCIKKHRS